jgi:hypothetical protein
MRVYDKYCYESYRDLVRLQFYFADNNVSMEYTNTVSPAELIFMSEILGDFIEEKNRSINNS